MRAIQRQGFYSRSRGRDSVTALRGDFETLKCDEALIGLDSKRAIYYP